ncbi:SurA N-terminal domain-containing protein [Planomonospora parontospora]|uniref:SurA N-terminal domain-containing protein n=1 Tax=Planomonospora parontospora TaxID=58119 RepID=UPI001670411E|nr:SurA N-terminal domain-containing protein [Planomonospora parontospora]
MKSTRVRVILAAVAVGATLTACSPAQVGAAAVVGDQRISSSELEADVKEYEAAVVASGLNKSQLQLRGSVPQAVLTNVIAIEQLDQLGARKGVTVTEAEVDAFLNQIATQGGQTQRMPDEQIAVNVGVPPSKLRDLVRITLVERKLLAGLGAGQDEASQKAASQKLAQEAATIEVVRSPRYGVANPQSQGGADSYVDAGRFGAVPASS